MAAAAPVTAPNAADDPASRRIEGSGTPERAWRESRSLAAVATTTVQALAGDATRLVVVSPHPDDETLGVGGLLAQWCAAGGDALVLALTDGDASHPGSPLWPPARLAAARRAEQQAALAMLGGDRIRTCAAHLPDGGLSDARAQAEAFVAAHLRAGDVVLATWRLDGHPDHEAAGRAAAAACARHGLRLLEYPVWAWHWAAPDDARIPWSRARRVPLDEAAQCTKRAAAEVFRSQLEPDAATGRAPIVAAAALARLLRPFETVFVP